MLDDTTSSYHIVIMRLQAIGRSVETRISWSIRHGSPCCIYSIRCFVSVSSCGILLSSRTRAGQIFHPLSSKSSNWRYENYREARARSLSTYRRRQHWRRYRRALQALLARCIRGHIALFAKNSEYYARGGSRCYPYHIYRHVSHLTTGWSI